MNADPDQLGGSRPQGPRRPPRPPRPPVASDPPAPRSDPRRRPPRTARPDTPAVATGPRPGAGTRADPARPERPEPKANPPRPARRKPIPDAPGPRPERPARKERSRPVAVATTVTFRESPSGTVTAVPPNAVRKSRHEAPARPSSADRDAGHIGDVDQGSLLPATPSPRGAFRRRYGVVYDTQGPRVRMAVVWVVAVVASLAIAPLRPYGLATLYAVVAGAAAMQVVDAWHHVRTGGDRWVAALGASSLPVLATQGARPLGAGLLVLVVAALIMASRRAVPDMSLLASAGHTVLSAGLCGGAAASLVLLADYEIGAVIILLVYLMVYDASDYVVGSGATNGIEGPLAGGLFIGAATLLLAELEVPPFRGAEIWNFAVLAAVACPVGQVIASAMLPRADVPAPALRRLDSLLVAAPAWAGLLGLYLQRVAN